MAPAKGWPMPHNRFLIGSGRANTSRPQPFASDQGLRKKPSVDRGPKVRIAIRQPQMTITAGVRHAGRAPGWAAKRIIAGGLRARAPSFCCEPEASKPPCLSTLKRSDGGHEFHECRKAPRANAG